MLLSRYDHEVQRLGAVKIWPLIVTKDSPRRALFEKLNRGVVGAKKIKRLKCRAGVLRGNVFAGTQHGQRVVVKINPVKNKTRGIGSGAGSGGMNLYHHVRYISRSGAGENEERAVLFDGSDEGVNGKDFFERSKDVSSSFSHDYFS